MLCYHKIGQPPRGTRLRSLYVTPALFRKQMLELKEAGLHTVTLDAVAAGVAGSGAVVISFDDGYRSVMEHALPVLDETGFNAVQFLVEGEVGGRNEWDVREGEVEAPLMDESEVREWLKAGHAIGAHTVTHPRLKHLSMDEAREEIFRSKESLEDRFGVPVRHFCYPYGSFNRETVQLVREAGFATACTLRPGLIIRDTPRHELCRLSVHAPPRNFRYFLRGLVGMPHLRLGFQA